MNKAHLLSLRLPAAVLVAGALATLAVANLYQREARMESRARLSAEAEAYLQTLERGLASVIAVNQGVAAHTSSSQEIGPGQFHDYIDVLDAFGAWHVQRAIGFAPRVPLADLAEFEARARLVYPGFRVVGRRPGATEVFPSLHVHTDVDESAPGLDAASIPARWDAMRSAAALGRTVATAVHRSPLGEGEVMVAFTPVYRSMAPLETPEQRRAALRGFVYSVLVVEEMVTAALGEQFNRTFDLEIYDASSGRYRLLYDHDRVAHLVNDGAGSALARLRIDFAGRQWEALFFPAAGVPIGGSPGVWLVGATGVLLSLILSWLVHGLGARLRRRSDIGELARDLDRAFEHYPSAVYYLDTGRRFVAVNDKALAEFGLTRKELIGTSSEALIAPENRDGAYSQWQRAISGHAVSYETTVELQGERAEVHVVMLPMIAGSRVVGVLGIAENISERKKREAELRASRRMLQSIVDNLPQQVFWKDTGLRFLGCNRAFADFVGIGPEEIAGKTDFDLCNLDARIDRELVERYRDEDLRVIRDGERLIGAELKLKGRHGGDFWARTSKVPLLGSDGEVSGVLGVATDITERKMHELQLERLAHYDGLTRLPNRAFFLTQLEQAIARTVRNGGLLAVAFFDIDRFKSINDTWGHDVGDQVIQTFASRVKRVVREVDVVGRMGGDEFVMFSEGLAAREEMELVSERLLVAVREPIPIRDGLTLEISTSIGVAFHRKGVAADELLRMADQAMYAAKQAGRDAREFAD